MSAEVVRRRADRAVRTARRTGARVSAVVGRTGFPYRRPTAPRHIPRPPKRKRTGADFDTDWARRPLARTARQAIVEVPLRLIVRGLAAPEVVGLDRLADLRAPEEPPTLIFAANHASHVDAPLMLTSIPRPWRQKLVVGAAADYFFGTRVTGVASALVLGAFPIDRTKVNRRSAELASSLIADGWSLLIFPEGGRSPDGWGQPFRGGAGFLSVRLGVPVVPVHIEGAGTILGKGMRWPKPGRTRVTFGSPLRPLPGEDARRMGERIEAAVAALADESLTDWWSARRRAAQGATPSLTGPAANGWRRAWALTEHRARGVAGQRRRQKRSWPKV
jgi:1-acyl-sn-glycerol-3-phosphate acyltransferase